MAIFSDEPQHYLPSVRDSVLCSNNNGNDINVSTAKVMYPSRACSCNGQRMKFRGLKLAEQRKTNKKQVRHKVPTYLPTYLSMVKTKGIRRWVCVFLSKIKEQQP